MQASANVTMVENKRINIFLITKCMKLYVGLSCIKILSGKSAATSLICISHSCFQKTTIICIHCELKHFYQPSSHRVVISLSISLHNQGRNNGGAQFPGRWITMGAPNHFGLRRKVSTMLQVLSSIQYICFLQRTQIRIWGRQTCFLPWVPSNLVTPLCITIS